MEQDCFERLTEVMSWIAGGDGAALETLYVGFGDPIRQTFNVICILGGGPSAPGPSAV